MCVPVPPVHDSLTRTLRQSLQILNVAHNQITQYIGNEVLGLRSLIKLNLAHNKLPALSPSILRLPHLQAMSLHHNPFSKKERIVRRAFPSLRELAALRLLSLSVQCAHLPLPVEMKEFLVTGVHRCAVCTRPFYEDSCVEKIALRPWRNHPEIPFVEMFCGFECAMNTV